MTPNSKLKRIIQNFNQTITSIEVRTPSNEEDTQKWRILDYKNSLLLWGDDKVSQFEELIRLFLDYDNEIASSLNLKTVETQPLCTESAEVEQD